MIRREISCFLIAGTCGFVIDAGGVYVLSHVYDLAPVLARIPSFALAILATFFLNRYLTFAHGRSTPLGKSFIKYVSVNGVGQGFNFVIYTILVSASGFFNDLPVFAVAVGSAIVAISSFFMFKYVVFKPHDHIS